MPTAPPIRYGTMAARLPEGDVDVTALIPGKGDLELEIGFGRGAFLFERAVAAPASRILGIEIKAKWAHLVEERRKRLGLANVRAYGGDAREILPRLRPDGSLARVFVHFPDPWWKKRHAKRRVVDPDLLAQVGRLLRSGGELFVQTDVEERADELLASLHLHPQFSAERVDSNAYRARSNREARAEADGLPVYRILARRR